MSAVRFPGKPVDPAGEDVAAPLQALLRTWAVGRCCSRCATLFAAAIRAYEFAVQTELDPLERELREYTIASIAQLDETTREAILEAGRNMSLEEAIDYALQTLA